MLKTLVFYESIQLIKLAQFLCPITLMLSIKEKYKNKNKILEIGFLSVAVVLSLYVIERYTLVPIRYVKLATLMCGLTICYKGSFLHKLFTAMISIMLNCGAQVLLESLFLMWHQPFGGEMNEKFIIECASLILAITLTLIFNRVIVNLRMKMNTLNQIELIGLNALAFIAFFVIGVGLDVYRQVMSNVSKYDFLQMAGLVIGMIYLDMIFIISKSSQVTQYKEIIKLYKKQTEDRLEYYKKIETMDQTARMLKHDMKNHLICVQELLGNQQVNEAKDYIASMIGKSGFNDHPIRTGNSIFDVIMNEKYQECSKKNIALEWTMRDVEYVGVEDIDMCAIVANALDNAIEATEKIPLTEKRWIEIKCTRRSGYVCMIIKNNVLEDIKINKKMLVATTKSDNQNHGYGLKSIGYVVNKYKGEWSITCKDKVFTMEVIIADKNNL